MQAMGKYGNTDDESLISYIIHGIQDYSSNKVILHEAETLNDLRNKLRVYEKMKKVVGQSTNTEK